MRHSHIKIGNVTSFSAVDAPMSLSNSTISFQFYDHFGMKLVKVRVRRKKNMFVSGHPTDRYFHPPTAIFFRGNPGSAPGRYVK